MKKIFNLVALVVIAACGKDSVSPSVGPVDMISRSWVYVYADSSGYTEGLDSIKGSLRLSRNATDLKLTSETGVTGYFWGHNRNSDTVHFVALVYPAGGVMNIKTTQSGDTLKVSSADVDAWPAYGNYVVTAKGIDFVWLRSNSVSRLQLRISYE